MARTTAFLGMAAIAGLMVATPAAASDSSGYKAISAGDFAGAARHLEAERRIFPDRVELMLNLAAAYTRLGRMQDARALYADVLNREPQDMDMPTGAVASSHAIASAALARSAPTFASR